MTIYDQKMPYDPYIFFSKAVRSAWEDDTYCYLSSYFSLTNFLHNFSIYFFFLGTSSRNIQLMNVIFVCVMATHPAGTTPV